MTSFAFLLPASGRRKHTKTKRHETLTLFRYEYIFIDYFDWAFPSSACLFFVPPEDNYLMASFFLLVVPRAFTKPLTNLKDTKYKARSHQFPRADQKSYPSSQSSHKIFSR
jgi:hypothetical protein